MSTVIVKIDTSGPTGRRILRNLKKHPKVVKFEYPIPEELEGEKLYTVQEAFADLRERVTRHYSEK